MPSKLDCFVAASLQLPRPLHQSASADSAKDALMVGHLWQAVAACALLLGWLSAVAAHLAAVFAVLACAR